MILAANTNASAGGGSLLILLVPLVLLGVFMWWSGRKRQKEAQSLTSNIEPGRDVVLRNGSVVTVLDENPEFITVEVSPGVTQRWVAGAVSRVLPMPGAEEPEVIETTADDQNDDDTK